MVNTYTTEFFANCPTNGARIRYRLRIETAEPIRVEEILAAVEAAPDVFHEELADDFLARFGGTQTLTANHHGVDIETTRHQ